MSLRCLRLLVLISCIPISITAKVDNTDLLISRVFDTIEKIESFFASDYSSINVDGLFGLRVAQGQVKLAVTECRENECGLDILTRLVELDIKMNETATKAMPYIEESDPGYFNRFKQTVSRPYILPYHPVFVDSLEEEVVGDSISSWYDEEKGDICYARLMGTFTENGIQIPKCNVTASCLQMMLRDNTASYALTHQLLYFIVLEHMGCKNSGSIDDDKITSVQRTFCSKIYGEAKDSVKRTNVPRLGRDLFLEQTMLCGSLGFEDFMKEEWITMVLRWPDKNEGCFRLNKIDFVTIGEETTDNFARNKKLKNTQIINFFKNDIREEASKPSNDFKKDWFSRSRASMRKPLREQAMKDGCLSHTTGLGLGVFGIFLRYLLRLM